MWKTKVFQLKFYTVFSYSNCFENLIVKYLLNVTKDAIFIYAIYAKDAILMSKLL